MPLSYTPLQASVLRVSGADAAAYLQGQCTADLRVGLHHHALWLNRKGRVLAYTLILPQPDGTWLLISPALAAEALEKIITANLIADDVSVVDETSQWQTGVLWGQGVPAGENLLFIPTPAYGVSAWITLSPQKTPTPWPRAPFKDLDEKRIGLGVPAVPADCGLNEFPQECGLDYWVSDNKGCYLGQEVMARIQSMGALRRILRCVESASGDLAAGQELRAADGLKLHGLIKSAAGRAGLALVSVDLVEGAELHAPSGVVRLGRVAKLSPGA